MYVIIKHFLQEIKESYKGYLFLFVGKALKLIARLRSTMNVMTYHFHITSKCLNSDALLSYRLVTKNEYISVKLKEIYYKFNF